MLLPRRNISGGYLLVVLISNAIYYIQTSDINLMEELTSTLTTSHFSTGYLNSELVRVSEFDHQLLVLLQLSDTDSDFLENLMKTIHSKACSRGLVKKNVLRRVIKLYAARVILVINSDDYLRKRFSLVRCLAGKLPEMAILQAVHGRKIVFKRSVIRQLGGFELNSEPKFFPDENKNSSNSGSDEFSRSDEASVNDENEYKDGVSLKSISIVRRELPESSNLGWPLCRKTMGPAALRSMSLVEWVMSLPKRSLMDTDSDETDKSFSTKTGESIRNECIVEESDGRSINSENQAYGLCQEFSSNSKYELAEESEQLTPGWPLLRIKTSESVDSSREYESSIASTGTCEIDLSFKEVENSAEENFCEWEPPGELKMKKKLVLKLKSSGCKQFSFKELAKATRNFSSENLIGEGGCSNVYRGSIRRGKLMAVKVLKEYKEAWNDFYLEVNIICSVRHKHITHLIGVCIEDSHLILVYNFLSKGSLEECLQGHDEKSILPWKMRFRAAVAVAEALNYLHDGCPRPVIHRDVKSSNILFSNDFDPQLSDFGLATWGPRDSASMISSDVVGTFGYIAPEYFMHGRVSDKTDIYSFGIVLLELLTGKMPISSQVIKGQQSLVKWAMPLLENGDLEDLLDSKLGGDFNIAQMQRMVLAATLCIKQSPRLRPKASQVLELLREENDINEWINAYANDLKDFSNDEVDDFSVKLDHNQCLDISSLVSDNNDESLRSVKNRPRLRLKDHLKERLD
ncbi:protein kinase STUNTED-like [Mercurialis annua]|uniref:protein kinase STUNTED-like n=1 Tax=Mercurialis annua TaxID=3986 RepID=UPI0024AF5953|nr:protein kinase STUNTED-like [Mercurialis annua]